MEISELTTATYLVLLFGPLKGIK